MGNGGKCTDDQAGAAPSLDATRPAQRRPEPEAGGGRDEDGGAGGFPFTAGTV